MNFLSRIGPTEILLILLIALLLFGAKKLPDMGRSLGRSMREFKDATKGLGDEVKAGMEESGSEEGDVDGATGSAASGAEGSDAKGQAATGAESQRTAKDG